MKTIPINQLRTIFSRKLYELNEKIKKGTVGNFRTETLLENNSDMRTVLSFCPEGESKVKLPSISE